MISLNDSLLPLLSETFPVVPSDSGLNGLQILQHNSIRKIGFAVSANVRTIALAIEEKVDTLIVHHGLFWGRSPLPLTRSLGERVSLCVEGKINLLAYHLPLDMHATLGNNAQLGLAMGWKNVRVEHAGLLYKTEQNVSIDTLEKQLQIVCKAPVEIHTPGVSCLRSEKKTYTIGWCTGAGGDFMEHADCDIFITGEYAERHFDVALETQTTLIKAGHYATERLGILALQQHLSNIYSHKVETSYLEAWSPW